MNPVIPMETRLAHRHSAESAAPETWRIVMRARLTTTCWRLVLVAPALLGACTTTAPDQERADVQIRVRSSGSTQISNVEFKDHEGQTHFTAQVAQGFKPGAITRFPRLHLDLTVAEEGQTSQWRVDARGWSNGLRYIRNGYFRYELGRRLANGSMVTVTYHYDDSHRPVPAVGDA